MPTHFGSYVIGRNSLHDRKDNFERFGKTSDKIAQVLLQSSSFYLEIRMPNSVFISNKSIPVRERLIMALDVSSIAEAQALVEELGDSVIFYKLGMELFMSGDYFGFIEWLKARNKKVFVDLKFFDIPATVGRAIKALSNKGVDLATIHGNDAIMEAAAESKGDLKVLAVTALTSLGPR